MKRQRFAALIVALSLGLAPGVTACDEPPTQKRPAKPATPDKNARGGRGTPPPCKKGEREVVKNNCVKKDKKAGCPPGKKKLLGVCVEDVD